MLGLDRPPEGPVHSIMSTRKWEMYCRYTKSTLLSIYLGLTEKHVTPGIVGLNLINDELMILNKCTVQNFANLNSKIHIRPWRCFWRHQGQDLEQFGLLQKLRNCFTRDLKEVHFTFTDLCFCKQCCWSLGSASYWGFLLKYSRNITSRLQKRDWKCIWSLPVKQTVHWSRVTAIYSKILITLDTNITYVYTDLGFCSFENGFELRTIKDIMKQHSIRTQRLYLYVLNIEPIHQYFPNCVLSTLNGTW